MAHVDGDYHPAEMDVIRSKMQKIFPKESDPETKLQEAVRQYKAFDQTKLTEMCKATFNHFSQVKFVQKYKVYTDMYEIINADGTIDESETKALEVLKEIIDLGSESKSL